MQNSGVPSTFYPSKTKAVKGKSLFSLHLRLAVASGGRGSRMPRRMRSEAELIRALQRRFPAGGGVRVGIGDDAAVLAGASST